MSSAAASPPSTSAAADYHFRIKHSLTAGYAREPGRLDWANQPNPFLRFSPETQIPLPNPPSLLSTTVPYSSLFHSSPPPPQPLTVDSLSALLFHSLTLSTWKSTGLSTWSLRVNLSSGKPAPDRGPPRVPASAGPCPPRRRPLHSPGPPPGGARVGAHRCGDFARASHRGPGPLIGFLVGGVKVRRAAAAVLQPRHDVGHALAAVSLAAAALGWDARLLDGLSDEDLGRLVGVEKGSPAAPQRLPDGAVKGKAPWMERQHPDRALLLFPAGSEPVVDYARMTEALRGLGAVEWVGKVNRLSKDHVVWDVI